MIVAMRKRSRFSRYQPLFIGGAIVAAFLLGALLASWVAPHDPLALNVMDRLTPPNDQYWLGTDHFGRDLFSRLVYGARISMLVGTGVVVAAGTLGTIIGLTAAYYRRFDGFIMRVMDGLMAFPPILLALAIVAALGPRVSNLIVALTIPQIPRVARLVRSSALVIAEMEHVQAARAYGCSDGRILVRHVLPLTWSPLIVQMTLIFAHTVLAEASLTFLNVGAPPEVPTWGNILSEGRIFMFQAPWLTVAPGVAILTVVLGLNMLGDGLRDLLDPRLRNQ